MDNRLIVIAYYRALIEDLARRGQNSMSARRELARVLRECSLNGSFDPKRLMRNLPSPERATYPIFVVRPSSTCLWAHLAVSGLESIPIT